MKRHHNGISEEHIVAYLDGELNVNGEMREALGDEEILHVTKEHAMLKKIFARTSAESRFRLKKATDARVLAYLHDVLRGANNRMPDAAPVRNAQPAVIRTKSFWAKRTTIGVAFAVVIGLLWFAAMPKSDQLAAPTVAQTTTPQPAAPQVEPSEPTAPAVIEPKAQAMANQEQPAASVVRKIRKQAPAPTNIASEPNEQPAANIAQQESSPGDVMISRRYAKLIKGVRIVEVTQQDKM